jgi:hypothetical protein
MSKEKWLPKLIGFILIFMLINSLVLFQIYQTLQHQQNIQLEMTHQILSRDDSQNFHLEELASQLLLLETAIQNQSDLLVEAQQQVNWLTEENELLKKKLH